MLDQDTLEAERLETVEELSDLLTVTQEMGRRLAYETHGDAYRLVREFNEALHQARGILRKIQQTGASP